MTNAADPSEPTESKTTDTDGQAPWEPSTDPDPASAANEGWAAEFDEAPMEDSLPAENPTSD